jgi:photosystem II stability/assembly factor-like uncharacterized protein
MSRSEVRSPMLHPRSSRRRGGVAARVRAATVRVAAAAVTVVTVAIAAPAVAGATPPPTWTITSTTAPAMQRLNGVACPSASTCFAVGGSSTGISVVRKSADGGTTWATVYSAVPGVTLSGIACATTSTCVAYVAGLVPLLVWTSDGGTSWIVRLPQTTVAQVDAVTCPDATTCVAGALNNLGEPEFLRTTDSGVTWSSRRMPIEAGALLIPYPGLAPMTCVSTSICLIIGGTRVAELYRTTDGGVHWRQVKLPSHLVELINVSCPTAHLCVSVGRRGRVGAVYASTDRGHSWRLVAHFPKLAYFSTVACGSATSCVAAGTTSQDRSMVTATTTDGAATWHEHAQAGGIEVIFQAVTCVDAATCVLVGEKAPGVQYVATSSNGGAAFTQVDPQPAVSDPISVSCPVVGICERVGISASGGIADHSTDGGVTWTPQTLPLGTQGLEEVHCPTALVCDAIGYTSASNSEVLFRTVDGGTSWVVSSLPSAMLFTDAWACPTATKCVVAGEDNNFHPIIEVTNDGGVTWSDAALDVKVQQGDEVTSMTCPSANVCVAGGDFGFTSGYLSTSDGGQNWALAPSAAGGPFGNSIAVSISCSSDTTCVSALISFSFFSLIGGGAPSMTIERTTDGGAHWTEIHTIGGQVNEVRAVECRGDGWCLMVGGDFNDGTSYDFTSTDGGLTWSASLMPVGWLLSASLSCPADNTCASTGFVASGSIATAVLS